MSSSVAFMAEKSMGNMHVDVCGSTVPKMNCPGPLGCLPRRKLRKESLYTWYEIFTSPPCVDEKERGRISHSHRAAREEEQCMQAVRVGYSGLKGRLLQ